MGDFWGRLFDSSDFMARRHCGDWSEALIQLHVVSDLLIWLAYLAIPGLLVFFVLRRKDIPFNWMFLMFGAFIVSCGFTHFIDAIAFDRPMYRLAGVVKALTAVVSLGTVAALVPLLPRALALPGVARLNAELQREMAVRLEAQRRLEDSARQLADSNAELERFAYVASHDLREPLRKVIAFGDRLQDRAGAALDAESRDDLGRIRNAAKRLQELVDGLLQFSRAGRTDAERKPVALDRVVAGVLDDLEESIRASGAKVEVGPLPVVSGDELRLRQLFQNLVANALKYRRADVPAHVTIDAGLHEGMHEIRVRDQGIGFPPEEAERVFELFYRLHPRHKYEGTGMGLAICRRIAEVHGGTIRAEAYPGVGATFVVRLPVAPATS